MWCHLVDVAGQWHVFLVPLLAEFSPCWPNTGEIKWTFSTFNITLQFRSFNSQSRIAWPTPHKNTLNHSSIASHMIGHTRYVHWHTQALLACNIIIILLLLFCYLHTAERESTNQNDSPIVTAHCTQNTKQMNAKETNGQRKRKKRKESCKSNACKINVHKRQTSHIHILEQAALVSIHTLPASMFKYYKSFEITFTNLLSSLVPSLLLCHFESELMLCLRSLDDLFAVHKRCFFFHFAVR